MNYRFDVLQNQSKFSKKNYFNNYSNLQSTYFQSNINACTFIIVDIINHCFFFSLGINCNIKTNILSTFTFTWCKCKMMNKIFEKLHKIQTLECHEYYIIVNLWGRLLTTSVFPSFWLLKICQSNADRATKPPQPLSVVQ